jgi:hypothetical protein
VRMTAPSMRFVAARMSSIVGGASIGSRPSGSLGQRQC